MAKRKQDVIGETSGASLGFRFPDTRPHTSAQAEGPCGTNSEDLLQGSPCKALSPAVLLILFY